MEFNQMLDEKKTPRGTKPNTPSGPNPKHLKGKVLTPKWAKPKKTPKGTKTNTPSELSPKHLMGQALTPKWAKPKTPNILFA